MMDATHNPRRSSRRGQMRTACDSCRKSKTRCEKPDNFPSCISCHQKGLACIITKSSDIQSLKKLTNPSLIDPADFFDKAKTESSGIVGFKQWSARFLYDYIYTSNPSPDIGQLPVSWKSLIQGQCGENWNMILDWMIHRASKAENTVPNWTMGQQQIYVSLPSEEDILHVLDAFSDCTVGTFPLFLEERLEWVSTRKYADSELIQDTQCWASLNVALAIGYKYIHIQNAYFHDADWKSKAHLKNAVAAVPQLVLASSPTLATVETLLGIVFLLQSALDITIHQNLLSVAIRLSQELGLDRLKLDRAGMTKAEYEKRIRVFWIGYTLDKSTSFTLGLMGCEDSDDVDIELPDDDFIKNTGLLSPSDGREASLFRLLCELAVIRHKMYKSLYSTKSVHIDNSQYEYITRELSKQLDSWRKLLPTDSEIYPESFVHRSGEGLILPRLLVSYHNSIISLYQWSLFYRDNSHRKEANHRKHGAQETWTLLCLSSARQTAMILQADNCRNTLGVRNMISYAFTAHMIIFMHILDNPLALTLSSDLQNLHILRKYLADIVEENSSSASSNFREDILSLVRICSRCECLARRSSQQPDLFS